MEIKIYAPQDCFVKSIDNCIDDVFSQKMLGDGIVIVPKDDHFSLPFDEAKCSMIFDTKHAYGFKVNNDIDALIHCGIDTVKLKGEPFEVKVKINKNYKKGDDIFNINLSKLKEAKVSNETPIVFETFNLKSFKVRNFSEGEYKKGDLICTIFYENNKVSEDKNTFKEFRSKYSLTAEYFINAVGGKSNYSKVYNCMTRLRFSINDKNKVDSDKIQKNELVKGINWNGNELQIIIGGECYKVKDEIVKIENYNPSAVETKKLPVFQRIMSTITGIMIPNIPILMAAGILAAIFSILTSIGLIDEIDGNNMASADLFTSILFILQKVPLVLVGVFFCINTVKYFGGNDIFATIVGLILVSRFFYAPGGISSNDEYSFGVYITNSKYGINGWYLFSIVDYPITIRGYEGSILPFIIAGIICFYSDKWIKTWMPSMIDIVFRGTLVILISILPTLFILGPTLSLIEFGMVKISIALEFISGFGTGIFAMIWQPLVLTGVHVAISMALIIPLQSTPVIPSLMIPALYMAVMAQVAVAMGIAIKTKNKNLKSVALSSIPAGLFGITEPVIYGVNLPKMKPFIIGCISAFFGGMLSGFFSIKIFTVGGQGLLGIFTVEGNTGKGLFMLAIIVTMSISILLTLIFYTERKNEYNYSIKITKQLKNILKKIDYKDLVVFENEINDFLIDIKNNKSTFVGYEKYLQKLSSLENKIIAISNKEEINKQKLYKNAKNVKENLNISEEKKNKAISDYNNYSLEDIKAEIIKSKEKIIAESIENVSKYEKYLLTAEKAISDILNILNIEGINEFKNLYWNALNSVDIGYNYKESKANHISKSLKLEFKELMLANKQK